MKEKILKLRNQGKTYLEISKELRCSKSLVAYYCNNTTKEKASEYRKNRRKNQHPLKSNVEHFIYTNVSERHRKRRKNGEWKSGWKKAVYDKLRCFERTKREGVRKESKSPTIKVQEVIDKFGENPRCYLTGEKINWEDPSSYSLDHKIPFSRGGESTLENMGLCTSKANRAKSDMTPEEFIEFCKIIVEYNK